MTPERIAELREGRRKLQQQLDDLKATLRLQRFLGSNVRGRPSSWRAQAVGLERLIQEVDRLLRRVADIPADREGATPRNKQWRGP